jgi:hypothetical protein
MFASYLSPVLFAGVFVSFVLHFFIRSALPTADAATAVTSQVN